MPPEEVEGELASPEAACRRDGYLKEDYGAFQTWEMNSMKTTTTFHCYSPHKYH